MAEQKKKVGKPAKVTTNLQTPLSAPEAEISAKTPEGYVPQFKYDSLQESYRFKCEDYDKLLNAYRRLALRFTEAGTRAKQFITTAHIGLDLLFPEDNKGEN